MWADPILMFSYWAHLTMLLWHRHTRNAWLTAKILFSRSSDDFQIFRVCWDLDWKELLTSHELVTDDYDEDDRLAGHIQLIDNVIFVQSV